MAVINRESDRRKKRTTNIAAGLIGVGILATGVYAIRNPYSFLRALSHVDILATGVRKSSHFLQNISGVKDAAVNRLSRIHVLERLSSGDRISELGGDLYKWAQLVADDISIAQRKAGVQYTSHLLERDINPLEFVQNIHAGVRNMARNLEYMDNLTPSARRSSVINKDTIAKIIDGIVDRASPKDSDAVMKIAGKLGIEIPQAGGKITIAKIMAVSDDFMQSLDDDFVSGAIRDAAGIVTDAEKRVLKPIADEFVTSINKLKEGRVGSAFIDSIISSIKSGDNRFLRAEIDPLVRLVRSGEQVGVSDLRLAAQQIMSTERFLRTSFRIPFANINPLSIISPAGRELRNQTHFWSPDDIPHELYASIGGTREETRRGLWLIDEKLWTVGQTGQLRNVVGIGAAERKYVAVEAGRYREMFAAMSGNMNKSVNNNFLRDILDKAIAGKPIDKALHGLLDTFDLYQSRQSIWTRMISFFTKGKFSPTNYHPPTFLKKIMSMDPKDIPKFINDLRGTKGFDESKFTLQLRQYLESGVQGPIHDRKMDIGISKFIKDISDKLNVHAEDITQAINANQTATPAFLAAETVKAEQMRAAAINLSNIGAKIESNQSWLNDSKFMSQLMDALSIDEVSDTGVIREVITGAGGGTENLNELRRVVDLWKTHKYNLLNELYTVGKGTQTISPIEHPQLYTFTERAELAFQRTIIGTGYMDDAAGYMTKADIFRMENMRAVNFVDNAMQSSSIDPTGFLERLILGSKIDDVTGVAGIKFNERFGYIWDRVQRIKESRRILGIDTDIGLGGYMDFDDELRYGTLYSQQRSKSHTGGGPGYEIGVVARTYHDPLHYARVTRDKWKEGFDNTTLSERLVSFANSDEDFAAFIQNEWELIKKGVGYISSEIKGGNTDLLTGYFRQFFPNQPQQVTAASVSLYNIASSISHMLDPIGLGFGPRTYSKGPGGIAGSIFFNRALPIIGAAMMYNWIDRELEAVTGSGLDDRVSKQIAGARIGVAAMRDITGMTAATKYMYETFPGMEFIGKELVGTIPVLGDMGLNIGLDESSQELKEFYEAGYVPVRSGRWWLASKTPWGGGRIAGYQPNWYMREHDDIMRPKDLQAAERFHSMLPSITPGPGWNPLSPIAGLLDPYWKERYYYKERPYPVSGPLMNSTTPGSGIINATLGNILKPRIPLHPDEMREAREILASISPGFENNEISSGDMGMKGFQEGGTPGSGAGGSRGQAVAMSEDPLTMRMGNHTTATYMKNGIWTPDNIAYQMGLAEYQTTELIGLRGFAFSIIKPNMATNHPVLEEFNVGTIEQNWWGANIGSGPMPIQAMQETTEVLRRFWPHERREVERFNPLRNTQPTWMPDGTSYFEDFLHGDPYSRGKVPREGIIAGPGFENIWKDTLGDLMYRGPRASMIGYDYEKQIEYFLGIEHETEVGGIDYAEIGDIIHSKVQTSLANAGVLVEAERFARDQDSGATGHIDAIVDFGAGEEIIEIKALSSNRYENLPAQGYQEHISQLNFYMKQQGKSKGYLYYISMEDHNQTKLFELEYNPAMYSRDISRARRAQEEAKAMIESGAVSPYQSYSATARAMILALSAPWSDEFKEEWEYAIGDNPDMPWVGEMLSRFKNMSDDMKQRHRFTPYKYLGVPDPPDADPFQRLAGPVWEIFAHMDTPVHTKLAAIKSPLESYERDYIYGEDFGDWGQPVERWIKPMARSLASKSPLYAIPFGAAVGWMFGNNRGGGIAGARTGAIIGGALSLSGSIYEAATGKEYIPSDVIRLREINEYFDRLKYVKWAGIYGNTEDPRALQQMIRTQYGMDPQSGESIYAVMPSERSYIKAFENEQNARNRQTIMEMVSKPGRRILQARWEQEDEGRGESMSEYFADHHLPAPDWEGWQPDTNIDDYKVAYLDYQGLDAHDYGIWEEDQSRAQVRGTRFERGIKVPLLASRQAMAKRAEDIMLKLGMPHGQVVNNVMTNDTRREIQIDVRTDITDKVYDQIVNDNLRASFMS